MAHDPVSTVGFRQQSANNNQPILATTADFVCVVADCVRELVSISQGAGYVASLASGTLGVLVQSDVVRAAVLERIGGRPILRTDVPLPGMALRLSKSDSVNLSSCPWLTKSLPVLV